MIRFRNKKTNIAGIQNAPNILARNLRGGLESLGKHLRRSARTKMRNDLGGQRKSLKILVHGKPISYSLDVYSEVVQAFIDAYGLKPGTFPPFKEGSRIYAWTERKLKQGGFKGQGKNTPRSISHLSRKNDNKSVTNLRRKRIDDSNLEKKGPKSKADKRRARKKANTRRFAFLVARAVYEKGIKANAWNTKTLEANKARIIREVKNAISRAVNEINRTK